MHGSEELDCRVVKISPTTQSQVAGRLDTSFLIWRETNQMVMQKTAAVGIVLKSILKIKSILF